MILYMCEYSIFKVSERIMALKCIINYLCTQGLCLLFCFILSNKLFFKLLSNFGVLGHVKVLFCRSLQLLLCKIINECNDKLYIAIL